MFLPFVPFIQQWQRVVTCMTLVQWRFQVQNVPQAIIKIGAEQSHHFNQVFLLHHKAHPADSVLQKNSRKQKPSLCCSLTAERDKTQVLNHLTFCTRGCMGLSNMDTCQTITVGPKVSLAPCPCPSVHPVGPDFDYTPTRCCSLRDTEPVTDRCSLTLDQSPNRHLKITVDLQHQCCSAHSNVKRVTSSQNSARSNFSLRSNT